MIIANKYKLIEKIDSGSFGKIYKAQNIRSNEYVAVKIESVLTEVKLLKNETRIYHYLNGCIGIPNVKWFGLYGKNHFMVINLLGSSLEELKKQEMLFSLNLVINIGIQIVKLLEIIHNNCIIHRDIKPANFLMGLDTENTQIYVIDFGFGKRFVTEKNTHIDIKKTSRLIGTPNFASMNSHNLNELSRRDDLESLAYTLIYLYYGTLPWERTESTHERIYQEKVSFYNSVILTDDNILFNYLKYTVELKFDEKPDYKGIINMFTENKCISL
jgi:serine/threonine protein kinase